MMLSHTQHDARNGHLGCAVGRRGTLVALAETIGGAVRDAGARTVHWVARLALCAVVAVEICGLERGLSPSSPCGIAWVVVYVLAFTLCLGGG